MMAKSIFPAAGISVAALVLATIVPGSATASHPDGPAADLSAAYMGAPGASAWPAGPSDSNHCFSSLDDLADAYSFVSQDFTDYAIMSMGADDFKCKGGRAQRKLNVVTVLGRYFVGLGPADSFNVTVYKSLSGEPNDARVKCSFPAQDYTVSGEPGTVQTFTIPLVGPTCRPEKGRPYWLEVQAVMAYDDGGQWHWQLSLEQNGSPADWKDPDDYYQSGCVEYQNGRTMEDCYVGGEDLGPDFMFHLT